jgi:glycosyltransferase involved in cell wall biosynthesis
MASRVRRPPFAGASITEIGVVIPDRPLPIGFLFSRFAPGGTERQMTELVRRLDPARWQVHVGCFRAEGAWLERVREVAPVTDFEVRSLRSSQTLAQANAFARWCTHRNLAVVHTADLPSNIFGQPAAALARVPVRIANRRDVNPGRTALELIAQRIGYACAHRVVANCTAAADRLRREGVPPRRISVVPNGLDFEAYTLRKPAALVRRVTTVANLRREKGHDVLLDAAAIVLRQFPDARFDLVGTGPELAALRARAEALNLGAAVSFLGHREDVPAQLAAADLFVLPSRSEAFPNAVLEAMATGLPSIATAVGGLVEVIEDQCNGVLIPPDNPEALAREISRLMADPARAAQLGAAGRARARSFSFTRMVAAFEDIYLTEWARRVGVGSPRERAAANGLASGASHS